jgi:nucleotide-binding universal stress UspA family protein
VEEVVQTVRTAKASQLRYLKLDNLAADPELAGRLPPDLAWRYHALPLAEDKGCITVAMAAPEDAEAREAVVAALGPGSYVVKGSAWAIDARLAEIWGNEARRILGLKVCAFPDPLSDELWDYSQALGALLGAHLGRMSKAGDVDALVKQGEHTLCDLVIFGKRCHPLIRRLLLRSTADGVLASQQNAVPFAVLVAPRPRWPLERILLLICGESADNGAVDWVLRLARPSTAAVTALAVVPPVPAMYHGLYRMEQGVAALLATDTALGRQMHQVARRLAEYKVDGTLRLRQGAPDQQICREVVEGDHDLIVMATRPCRWWLRQLKGDPICSLLNRVDRPVLLAGPTTALESGAT